MTYIRLALALALKVHKVDGLVMKPIRKSVVESRGESQVITWRTAPSNKSTSTTSSWKCLEILRLFSNKTTTTTTWEMINFSLASQQQSRILRQLLSFRNNKIKRPWVSPFPRSWLALINTFKSPLCKRSRLLTIGQIDATWTRQCRS